jgi:hypothetical protein
MTARSLDDDTGAAAAREAASALLNAALAG